MARDPGLRGEIGLRHRPGLILTPAVPHTWAPPGPGQVFFYRSRLWSLGVGTWDLQGLSRAQPAHAGHRHSQSAPLPFLPGRALSSVCDGPELRHRRTDVVNLYITYKRGVASCILILKCMCHVGMNW
jgi:hypothetical protein